MQSPHQLAEQRIQLAYDYSQYADELAGILARKPRIWAELRTQYKSDKVTDRVWEATKDGLREMQIRLIMKAIEKKLSAYKTMLDTLADEARNLY